MLLACFSFTIIRDGRDSQQIHVFYSYKHHTLSCIAKLYIVAIASWRVFEKVIYMDHQEHLARIAIAILKLYSSIHASINYYIARLLLRVKQRVSVYRYLKCIGINSDFRPFQIITYFEYFAFQCCKVAIKDLISEKSFLISCFISIL